MKSWLIFILFIAVFSSAFTPISGSGASLSFSYGKPLGDFSKFLEIEFIGKGFRERFVGYDTVDLHMLPSGTYYVVARWMGVEVGRWVVSIDRENSALNLVLSMMDLSLMVVDLEGRTLWNPVVEVSPEVYGEFKSLGGIIVIKSVPKTIKYHLNVSWRSPIYGSTASSEFVIIPSANGASSLILPVGDLRIKVVDSAGRPISGAKVYLSGVEAVTDTLGEVIYAQVPLERNEVPIRYDLTVRRDNATIYSGTLVVSRERTEFTVMAELYDLKVRVEGAAEQPLPYAKITVRRGGVELGTYQTDESGCLILHDITLDDYLIEAEWRGFRGSTVLSKGDLRLGKMAVVRLPPYTEVAGIPLTFSSFILLSLGAAIGIVLLLIGLIEYILWRGRKLGIYPAEKK